jgi:hypothetical protein
MKTKPHSPEHNVTPSSSEPENELFVSALKRVVSASPSDSQRAIEAAKRGPVLPRERYKYVPSKPRA